MRRSVKIRALFCLFALLPLQNSGASLRECPGARWISTAEEGADCPNSWIAFRRDVELKALPAVAPVCIAADTKYWLWINGECVVFEGGLKRGPTPGSTYYDRVDIAPFLRKGTNRIAVLLWHFGKDGFSHKDSGRAGLLFSATGTRFSLRSDSLWLCRIHPAFGDTDDPRPNFRLAESNIRFDARRDIGPWQTAALSDLEGFRNAREIGCRGDAPWGGLVERPIPQWKDFGVREARFERFSAGETDSVIVRLPYNMQMTPVITLDDPQGGSPVGISTDHSFAGGTSNIRAEYVTRRGVQQYESLGWMNGQELRLTLPKHVALTRVAYRETGYDTEPQGSFRCDDDFYNRFWQKALRTLYVNMRDNYFDCPDRERAQWWGDVVVLMGESFYAYSISAHALMRKAILELAGWQKPGGELFSPIPAGNYDSELPGQMLAAVGRYGFWNYYMNTGDLETIRRVYPAVKRYLSLWKTDDTGLTAFRKGGWTWGDWGDNRDIRLIFAGWHCLALEGAADMALALSLPEDAADYRALMARVKEGFLRCWDGNAFRHPEYHGCTDDRVQALAVLSGIADESYYGKLSEIFRTQFHASPYMEKYVMEALFRMGCGRYAMERTARRFADMVDDPGSTTLFEGWGIGEKGYGGGTTNHAWSGGALTVIAGQLCGIRPLEPGYSVFGVEPDPASFRDVSIRVPTVRGIVGEELRIEGARLSLRVIVPEGTTAVVTLPQGAAGPRVDGRSPSAGQLRVAERYRKPARIQLSLTSGDYRIESEFDPAPDGLPVSGS